MIKITDIANTVADRHELSQADANAFVTALFSVIEDGLRTGDRQVKVKGLGTFKVTSVSPRESVDVNTGERIVIEGREKIVFTPDAVLRDRVNRPFSQFETVTLRDDVNFSEIDKAFEQTTPVDAETPQKPEEAAKADTPAPATEEDLPEPAVNAEQPVEEVKVEEPVAEVKVEEPAEEVKEPAVGTTETDTVPTEEPATKDKETEVAEKTEDPKEDNGEKATEETETPEKTTETPQHRQNRLEKMQTEEQIFSESQHTSHHKDSSHTDGYDDEYDDERPRNTLAIWLTAAIIILLVIGGAGGGYLWHELSVRNDSIAILQTRLIDIEERIHHANTTAPTEKAPAGQDTPNEAATEATPTKEKAETTPTTTAAPASPTTAKAKEEEKSMSATAYDKDVRIRTGAYKIVGIDKTVTVKAGQTLASIARSHLGPGMECYVEAVNEKREYKAGDRVKLPKLELKKAAKKK